MGRGKKQPHLGAGRVVDDELKGAAAVACSRPARWKRRAGVAEQCSAERRVGAAEGDRRQARVTADPAKNSGDAGHRPRARAAGDAGSTNRGSGWPDPNGASAASTPAGRPAAPASVSTASTGSKRSRACICSSIASLSDKEREKPRPAASMVNPAAIAWPPPLISNPACAAALTAEPSRAPATTGRSRRRGRR